MFLGLSSVVAYRRERNVAVTKQMCFVAVRIFDWVVEGLKQDGGQMFTGECFLNLIVYCMYYSSDSK